MILQAVILFLLLGVAPMGAGLLMNCIMKKENRSMGMSYISGFLLLMALFQLIAVPIIFIEPWGFPLIIKIFTSVSTILAGIGIIQTLHMWRNETEIFRKRATIGSLKGIEKIQWLLVLLLIAFQIVMAITHASFDGDDAYYVVQSVITDETDTVYRILPYTGLTTSLDMRHSMAVFPIWIAYIARMTGIHATILSHTVLPGILILLTYGIYYEIGRKLFGEKKESLPVYMLVVNFLQIFGNVSIYSGATFFLMRTWQGKSMLVNVVIPALFLFLLWLFEGEAGKRNPQKGVWFMLFITNIVAAMMSTASVFLNTILLFVMALVLGIQEKKWKVIIPMAICCIPCIVYAMLYVFL